MRLTRWLLLGLITGGLIGVLVYLRSQRLRLELKLEGYRPGTQVRPPDPATPRPTGRPATTVARKPPAVQARDRLETIHGIGPVYARRLNAAGVHTFADLAALAPARIQEIIGGTRKPADPAAWIAEAKKLAA